MTKITAYMATCPGREDQVLQAVKSLFGQVDYLYLFLNPGATISSFDLPVSVGLVHLAMDKSSSAKYTYCRNFDGYVFICDDDIQYPEDYVQKSIENIEKYERKAIISYHGRIIEGKVDSFYKARNKYGHFAYEVRQDYKVNHIGDGVMAFHTDCLTHPFDTSIFNGKGYMSDIVMSQEINKRGIPMYVCSHKSGWLKQIPVKDSLGRQMAGNDRMQTEQVNSFQYPVIQ